MTSTDPDIDVKLMALADGELPDAQAAELRARIANNPELALRFADFVESRALLDMADGDRSAVPPHLVAAIRTAAAASPAVERAGLRLAVSNDRAEAPAAGAVARAPEATVALRTRHEPRPGRSRAWTRLPLAASIAAVAIAGVSGFVGYRLAQPTEQALAGAALSERAQMALVRALSGLPSGQNASWTEGGGAMGSVTIVATHRVDGQGERQSICRDFELVSPAPQPVRFTGLACRQDGAWMQRVTIAEPMGGGSYRPASSSHDLIDAMLATLGSTGPLGADEERGLLQPR